MTATLPDTHLHPGMYACTLLPTSNTLRYPCCACEQVKGDAFIARVLDDGDNFERMDLTLDEVSSGAAWVRQARAQNERKRQQVCWVGLGCVPAGLGAMVGQGDVTSPHGSCVPSGPVLP